MAPDTVTLAGTLVAHLAQKKWKITTAESCTGGLIAAAITDISGASDVFEQGVVTYANSAKTTMLSVGKVTLANHGAVSAETAKQMAEGARIAAKAHIAISATGIAGPTGGTPEKPVGLVFIGISTAEGSNVQRFHFGGGRQDIRASAVHAAMEMALTQLKNSV